MTLSLSDLKHDDVFGHDMLALPLELLGRQDRVMAMEVKETPSHYQILVEIPGVAKDKIRVNFDNGVAMISADHPKPEMVVNDERVMFSERHYGHLCRQIRVPKQIDSAQIKAQYDNGLLKLWLPKTDTRGEGSNLINID